MQANGIVGGVVNGGGGRGGDEEKQEERKREKKSLGAALYRYGVWVLRCSIGRGEMKGVSPVQEHNA